MTTRISPYLTSHAPATHRGEDWRDRAACRPGTGVELEWFFPEKADTAYNRSLEVYAKATCRECPSKDACLTWALETGQDAGIWGGMTPRERTNLIRRGQRTYLPAIGNVSLPREHGTSRGYGQHKYLKEAACPECLAAVNEIRQARRREIAATKRRRNGDFT